MNIRTANTILYCRRWEAMVGFYKEELGLPVTFSNDWFVEFELSATARLSVADEGRASIETNEGKGITITLEVDDIEQTHRALSLAELQPTGIKDHPWGAKVVHVHDPEGNRLEFWSPASGPG